MLCRHGTRGSFCQASLYTAYYRGTQCIPCAASAQSPFAALNGYDGTAPFHHTAYAASYMARSATRQAMPQAMPWRHFDKTGLGYAGRKIPTDRARKSRNKISVACNAIMSVQYVILYYIVGPTCRGLNGYVHASLEI